MHNIQTKIINHLKDQGGIISLKYRELGRKIGEQYPQTVKHHIELLKKSNLVEEKNNKLVLVKNETNNEIVNIPIYGTADCGMAKSFAEDKIQGFLKISRKILPMYVKNPKDCFLLKASGNSMNKANVNGKTIEDGDLVIIDSTQTNPQNGDYIVSVIDNFANIKKFKYNKDKTQVSLISESTDEYLPIILHTNDNLHISGKVVGVIKSEF